MARLTERRRRQRIDVALPIEIKYNKEIIRSETKNISVLGTYLEINREIPRGSTLAIKIEVPQAKTGGEGKKRQVLCEGLVFRSQAIVSQGAGRQYGTGIFFRSFLESGEKTISDYVNYILREEKKRGKIYMRKRKQKPSKKSRSH